MIFRHPHTRILFLLAIAVLLFNSCYKEIPLEEPEPWEQSFRVLEFDGVFASIDLDEHMLLFSLPSDTIHSFTPYVRFGDYQSITIAGKELKANEENDLGEVKLNHPYPVRAQKGSNSDEYILYFTRLPLLNIYTDKKIKDEPKVPAWMELAFSDDPPAPGKTGLFSGYAGIEIRGRTSADLEKKSYGLELWTNKYGADDQAALLGMRTGEDWVLDAMYVDPLRMRNKLSFEIWEKIWDMQSETPFRTSRPGVQCEYVELFINQKYMGLYCLTEKLDETLIRLSGSTADNGGVMYKAFDWNGGATAFQTYNSAPPQSMIWEGWEQIYPDHPYFWEPLAELRQAVVFDEDELFPERIATLLNLTAAAQYYLFVNLILAHDNIIKNYFLARYPGESAFLMLPWDLEASWGIMWHGGPSSSNGVLKNYLFERLMELDVEEFNDLVEDRWEDYRASVFQMDSLMAPVIRYGDLLKRSGAIDRENIRWPEAEIDLDQEISYYTQWLTLRLAYLDLIFD